MTSKSEALTASPQHEPVIRYAATDDDVIAMHRFLLMVARPAMQCEPDVVKSLEEVIRVTKHEVAIMVMKGDMLVGTMGVMRATWWYGNADFLTDRWHFVLPALLHTPFAKALTNEAEQIARAAGLKFVHQGKLRPAKQGLSRMMPRIYSPEG